MDKTPTLDPGHLVSGFGCVLRDHPLGRQIDHGDRKSGHLGEHESDGMGQNPGSNTDPRSGHRAQQNRPWQEDDFEVRLVVLGKG